MAPETPVPETGDKDDDNDDVPLAFLFPVNEITFDDYAAADDDVETCEELSTSYIVEKIVATRNLIAGLVDTDNE